MRWLIIFITIGVDIGDPCLTLAFITKVRMKNRIFEASLIASFGLVCLITESYIEVCYDSAMVPIDDINAEEIGGWRVKAFLDFNKTIINMNITRSHESLVALLPLEDSRSNPSYEHKECGVKASVYVNDGSTTIKDEDGLACFEWTKAIDFVKKDPGSPGVERCISASMRANVEHTEKQSSDENDTESVIITESETIGVSLCDGHLHNDTAIFNAVWLEGHLHPLPKVEFRLLSSAMNVYALQDENKTINLEFRGVRGLIGGNIDVTQRGDTATQYRDSLYGYINGTIVIMDHHHEKTVFLKRHISIFDTVHDRASWL
eukprot:g15750.t1